MWKVFFKPIKYNVQCIPQNKQIITNYINYITILAKPICVITHLISMNRRCIQALDLQQGYIQCGDQLSSYKNRTFRIAKNGIKKKQQTKKQ